jgi:CRISPR-associated endonuclease Cas2
LRFEALVDREAIDDGVPFGKATLHIGEVQYSVFLCRLTAADLVRLKSRLYDIIELHEDQVLFIPLCNRCAEGIEALGRPVEKHDARDVVIVT